MADPEPLESPPHIPRPRYLRERRYPASVTVSLPDGLAASLEALADAAHISRAAAAREAIARGLPLARRAARRRRTRASVHTGGHAAGQSGDTAA